MRRLVARFAILPNHRTARPRFIRARGSGDDLPAVLIPAKLNISITSEPSSDWHRISPSYTVCALSIKASLLPFLRLEHGISLAPRGHGSCSCGNMHKHLLVSVLSFPQANGPSMVVYKIGCSPSQNNHHHHQLNSPVLPTSSLLFSLLFHLILLSCAGRLFNHILYILHQSFQSTLPHQSTCVTHSPSLLLLPLPSRPTVSSQRSRVPMA
jgi:hypothetical protein